MKAVVQVILTFVLLVVACGGGSSEDGEAARQDSDVEEESSSIGIEYTGPQDAITGAYNLIGESRSAVESVNERTEQLEEMLEGD